MNEAELLEELEGYRKSTCDMAEELAYLADLIRQLNLYMVDLDVSYVHRKQIMEFLGEGKRTAS